MPSFRFDAEVPVLPPMVPGLAPPFYHIPPLRFQELCRDLFAVQQGIARCDVYGVNGQKQFGIDLLAYQEDQGGIEVGQCKCYKTFDEDDLIAATQEFLDHRERWSGRGLRKFILFVACSLDRRQVQDEIPRQARIFAAEGIDYEVLSAATISARLRAHPEIVWHHTRSDYWVRDICGEPDSSQVNIQASPHTSQVIDAALVAQNSSLSERLGSEVARGLEEMREAWREGRGADARAWVDEQTSDRVTWVTLSPPTKAAILRLDAVLALGMDEDIPRAQRLIADTAQFFTPTPRPAIDTLLLYRADGADAALSALAESDDIEQLNLRASILLEVRRLDDCAPVLARARECAPDNSETLRLCTLLALARGHVAAAQDTASRALALRPRWKGVRIAAALANYAMALSPLAITAARLPSPEPVSWILVKSDAGSVHALRQAADLFRGLAEDAANTGAERQEYEADSLAALANDRARQDEALNYCRGLLAADPAHYRAAQWAMIRGWSLDLKPTRVALSELVSRESADAAQIVALVNLNLYLAEGNPATARALLDATQARFDTEVLADVWGQLSALSTPDDEAREKVASRPVPPPGATAHWHARRVAITAESRATGDWSLLVRHLDAEFAANDDPRVLLERCELQSDLGDWGPVAEQADWLVESVATAGALHMAAFATYHAGDAARCLALLDRHRDILGSDPIPPDVRRLRSAALRAERRLVDALAEAEILVVVAPTTEHQLDIAQLYLDMGNTAALGPLAARLLEAPDLPAGAALRHAAALYASSPRDRRTALGLWERVATAALPDDLVPVALGLGFQLRRDADLASLIARASAMARDGRGGMQAITIPEAIELIGDRRRRAAELDAAYRRGEAPLHLVAGTLNVPLVDLYHRRLARNASAPDPLAQFALYARHGARRMTQDPGDATRTWRVHLDITAVLLAAHVDLLDVVERTFGTLHIPPSLVPALLRMRDRAEHPQPSRLEAQHEIIRLVDGGKVGIVGEFPAQLDADPKFVAEFGAERLSQLQAARAAGGYSVEFCPPLALGTGAPLTDIPGEYAPHLVSPRAVAESLLRAGPLAMAAYEQTMRSLGDDGDGSSAETVPTQRRPLYCDETMLETLSAAGLLVTACDRFAVRTSALDIEHIRAEVDEDAQRGATAAWLDELLVRIASGIDARRYEVLPDHPLDQEVRELADHDEPGMSCMVELLRFAGEAGDVIWVDDRFVTGYLHAGSAPIIGIVDILHALRERGASDQATHFRHLAQLRAANVRFLPLEAAELVYHLEQAQIDGTGALVETGELETLRRYVACCLTDTEALQRPPRPEGSWNPLGELTYLLQPGHAVMAALEAIWSGEPDVRAARARSEWLLSSIDLNALATARIAGLLTPNHDERALTAVSLVGLIIHGRSLGGVGQAVAENQAAYFHWLTERILERRFAADPDLVQSTADLLATLFAQSYDELHGKLAQGEDSDLVGLVLDHQLLRLLPMLPTALQDALAHDARIAARVADQRVAVAEVGGVTFSSNDFLAATMAAINGSEHTIRALKLPGTSRFHHHAEADGRPRCLYDHPVSGATTLIGNDALGFLHASPTVRDRELERLRPLLTWSDGEYRQCRREMDALADPGARMALAQRWLTEDASVHFAELLRQLTERQVFNFDRLIPTDPSSLLQSMRLAADCGLGDAFVTALAASVDTTRGIAAEMDRLAGLPTPLPTPLLATIAALDRPSQRALVKALLAAPRSLVADMHLCRVLWSIARGDDAFCRLAQKIAGRWLGPQGMEAAVAFIALLDWVANILSRRETSRDWPPHIRLAASWGCAHRLFAIFVSTGMSIEHLRDAFTARGVLDPRDWLEHSVAYQGDVAHPSQLRPVPLLLDAVVSAASDSLKIPLRTRFTELATQAEGQNVQIAWSLARDPSLASDGLGSYLAGDREVRWGPVVGDDLAAAVGRRALRAQAESAIGELGDIADSRSQAMSCILLQLIIDEHPVYPDLSEALTAGLSRVSFGDIARDDHRGAIRLLRFAANQAAYRDDAALRERIWEQVQVIVTEINANTDHEAEHLAFDLLEMARTLAFGYTVATSASVVQFTVYADQLSNDLPAAATLFRRVVQVLCEFLPPHLARELWPLLVQLRAV